MERDIFSEMEIDTIGEILNISMGAAATAVSTLLDRKVNITTPEVVVTDVEKVELIELEPAIGMKITYVDGITGSNIMVLRQRDVHAIVRQMTAGMVDNNDDDELDELSLSAIGEVMNQMMGASATALSDFLERSINISTPTPIELATNFAESIGMNLDEKVVLVNFQLDIEGLLNSKFVSIMSIQLCRELADSLLGIHGMIEEPIAPVMEQKVEPVAQAPVIRGASTPQPKPAANVHQERTDVRPVSLESFDEPANFVGQESKENLDLILGVPLSVSVEIGRAVKPVKEILEFTQGSIIELDKQAGAPVDILVNGQLIARGDVVVIGDNFGVRVSEIMKDAKLI